mgnify:FL=1
MKLYYNAPDLTEALFKESKAHPKLYMYPVSLLGEAYIWKGKRLNAQAPTDAMILNGERHYWKNGKKRKFTKAQIIADQQVGWR